MCNYFHYWFIYQVFSRLIFKCVVLNIHVLKDIQFILIEEEEKQKRFWKLNFSIWDSKITQIMNQLFQIILTD